MSEAARSEKPDPPIRILVVEDDRHLINQYNRCLSDTLFEKKFVGEGHEALELYSSWRPEVMLLDIMLPGMSGYMILKKIRNVFHDDRTVIIMASALSGKDDILDCRALGISAYIVKPIKPAEMERTILDACRAAMASRNEAGKNGAPAMPAAGG